MSVLNALLALPLLLLFRVLINSGLSNKLVNAVAWNTKEWHIKPKLLTDSQYIEMSELSNNDYQLFNETLDNILIPRVPATDGHRRVKKYITNTMRSLEWRTELDTFTANTPYGQKQFSNIIATLNPLSCKRLVFACHYDSKLSESGAFVGATDSAVPCTLLLRLVSSLDAQLKLHRDSTPLSETTLQLIFFDGEEAFIDWNERDSLYGSRHLARIWNKSRFLTTPEEISRCGHISELDSHLDRMEVMVLLDLLGSSNPNFYSHFADTHSLYSRFVAIEKKLNDLKLMEALPPHSTTNYFHSHQSWFGGIEDDHVPFERLGVPIVHIIPTPFPAVWHRDSDNRQNIHDPTVNNLYKIFKLFLIQYLHLTI